MRPWPPERVGWIGMARDGSRAADRSRARHDRHLAAGRTLLRLRSRESGAARAAGKELRSAKLWSRAVFW